MGALFEVDVELLTRREVAEILRVSPSTLCRWAQRGEGPRCIWLSPSAPRYPRDEVEKFARGEVA